MAAIGGNTALRQRPAPEKGGKGMRRCAVTGRSLPRDRLVRLVVGPDRRLVPDLDERLPGRGVWLSAEGPVIAEAMSGRHLSRALKGPVDVPEDLPGVIESGLASRAANLIGLARRAGAAVAGFEKARAALASGTARLLITARDGAAHGRAKLDRVASGVTRCEALDGAELGAVFGRPFAVHVVVTDPGFAARIEGAFTRLQGVRAPAQGQDGISGGAKLR